MTRLLRRMRKARQEGDRGAVIVEAVLVLPIVVMLFVALVEYGYAWRQNAMLERGVGNAARVASSLGENAWTDYETLRAVESAIASTSAVELERVIIYDADVNNGDVPEECESVTGPGGVAGVCNVYSAEQVHDDSLSGFPRGSLENPNCVGGSWDASWCPLDRRARRPNPDSVGVYLEARYSSITSLIPGTETTFSHSASFLLEPPVIGD